ncbi:MAG: hypothetical protein AAFN94_03815 [Pseudomonadota bacterium]
MEAIIEQAAQDMVTHLTQNNLTDIADYYSYPAAVYFDTKVIVLQSREELLHAVGVYRSTLASRRLARIVTRVIEAPRVKRDRFTVMVKNRYFDVSNQDIGTSRIRFYVQRERGCLKIRLVEYLDWPCARELQENEEFSRLFVSGSASRTLRRGTQTARVRLH